MLWSLLRRTTAFFLFPCLLVDPGLAVALRAGPEFAAKVPAALPVFSTQAVNAPEVSSDWHPQETGLMDVPLRCRLIRLTPRKSTRRGFLAAAAGAAAGVLAAQEIPTDELIHEASTPEEKDLAQRFQAYLADLSAEWSASSDPEHQAWGRYADSARAELRFRPADYPIPISVLTTQDPGTGLFAVHPKSGMLLFTLNLHPVKMGEMLRRTQIGSGQDRALARVQLNALIVKEIGGLNRLQKHRYLAQSLVLADRLASELEDPERKAEAIRYRAGLWAGFETEGYLVMGRYLATQPYSPEQLAPSPDDATLSPVTRSTLETVATWARRAAPSQPDVAWTVSVDHVFGEFRTAPKITKKRPQYEAYHAAAELEVEAGNVEPTEGGGIGPKHDPRTKRIVRDFMRYLGDPAYADATPEHIQAVCDPGYAWLQVPAFIAAASAGLLALIRRKQTVATAPAPTKGSPKTGRNRARVVPQARPATTTVTPRWIRVANWVLVGGAVVLLVLGALQFFGFLNVALLIDRLTSTIHITGHRETSLAPGGLATWLGGSAYGLYRLRMDRRRFLTAIGLGGLALAGEKVSVAQVPINFQQRKRRMPHPFPDGPRPIPRAVQAAIQAMDRASRAFQDTTLRAKAGEQGILILVPTQAEFEKRYNAYFTQVYQILWEPMWADIQAKGWKTGAEIAAIKQSLQQSTDSKANFERLFADLFPEYFAHYGLHFYAQFIFLGGNGIPDISLGPVGSMRHEQKDIDALHRTVVYRRYPLGPSLVRTLHDFYPAVLDSVETGTTWGTDQVLVLDGIYERKGEEALTFFEALAREKPKAARGDLLTPADEPDPLARATHNLLIELVAPLMARLTREQFKSQLAAWEEEFNMRHEAVHVADGLTPALNRPDIEFELRGGVGGAIGDPFVRYLTWRMMRFGLTSNPANRGSAQHALDYIYLRNRLGYWLWRERTGRTDVRQFTDLLPSERRSIWEAFPGLTNEQWWKLYQHVWDELQPSSNPLTQGLDQTDTRVADGGGSTATEAPATEPSVSWVKPAGILAVLAAAAAAWARWRNRPPPGPGPTPIDQGRRNRRNRRDRSTRRNFLIGPVIGAGVAASTWLADRASADPVERGDLTRAVPAALKTIAGVVAGIPVAVFVFKMTLVGHDVQMMDLWPGGLLGWLGGSAIGGYYWLKLHSTSRRGFLAAA